MNRVVLLSSVTLTEKYIYNVTLLSAMVHDTPSRQKARELRDKARSLQKEAGALDGIEGAEYLAQKRQIEAVVAMTSARDLEGIARLEDLTVRQEPLVKQTRKGERTYYRWVASWREGEKTKKIYLGSVKKLSQAAALQKARGMKAEALGVAPQPA